MASNRQPPHARPVVGEFVRRKSLLLLAVTRLRYHEAVYTLKDRVACWYSTYNTPYTDRPLHLTCCTLHPPDSLSLSLSLFCSCSRATKITCSPDPPITSSLQVLCNTALSRCLPSPYRPRRNGLHIPPSSPSITTQRWRPACLTAYCSPKESSTRLGWYYHPQSHLVSSHLSRLGVLLRDSACGCCSTHAYTSGVSANLSTSLLTRLLPILAGWLAGYIYMLMYCPRSRQRRLSWGDLAL